MPTYRITAPDGKTYNVTGDGTAEEALAQFQAQFNQQVAPRQTQPDTPPRNSDTSAVAQPDYLGDIGAGLRYAGQRASAGITGMLPRSVEEFLVKKGLSPSQEQLDASKQAVSKGSWLADAGQMLGDVGAQFLPSKKLTQATAGLTAARGLAANLAGQGAINAALTPDAENRAVGAGIGAGSAALGSLAGRVLGGPLRTAISKEGQALLDAGITPTPGQVLTSTGGGFGRTLSNTEKSLAHFPIVGDVVRARASRAGNELVQAEVNRALAPLGRTVSGNSSELVQNARNEISKVYDEILPEIKIPVASLPGMVEDALTRAVVSNPLLDKSQLEVVRRWDTRKIDDLIKAGQDIAGPDAQKLDQQLGQFVRKYGGTKSSVYNQDIAAAFKEVQDALRAAMVGTTPNATQTLANARTARAKLQTLIQAADPVTGEVTPKKLADVAAKRGELTPLLRAGSVALPELPAAGGTAGSLLLHNLFTPQALGAGAAGVGTAVVGGLPALLTGAAGVGAMYTKPGMKYLSEGVHPVLDALRKKKLNRDETEAVIQFLVNQPVRSFGNLENSNAAQ